MSLIENALKKLQAQGAQGAHGTQGAQSAQSTRPTTGAAASSASLLPTAASPAPTVLPSSRKKATLDSPKHHVPTEALVKEGLLLGASDQQNGIADQFRKIKRPLIVNALLPVVAGGSRMNVIMIASALPKAGKTFCSVNLAMSMALERDLNVLLVDADVAKPHITRAFGLADKPGLIDLLLDDGREIPDLLVRTDLHDIQVLPAGHNHAQATELLASDRMSRIVNEFATRYPDRLVLLDSPPLLLTSEAHALAGQVGQITLVVEAGDTTHQQITQALHILDSNKSINLILNKSRPWRWNPAGEYYGGYGYGYDGQ